MLLFSDIGSAFYGALGFTAVPERHQAYAGSILMAWLGGDAPPDLIERFAGRLPSYF